MTYMPRSEDGTSRAVTLIPGDIIGFDLLSAGGRAGGRPGGHGDERARFGPALHGGGARAPAARDVPEHGLHQPGRLEPVVRGVSSLNMQLQKELDLYNSPAHCANFPDIPTRHQVRHARDLCMDSLVSEEGARELFDDSPHWDDDATWASQEESLAGSTTAAQEVLDGIPARMVVWDEILANSAIHEVIWDADELFKGKPHPEVIWDEETQLFDGEMGDLLECKQAMLMAPVIPNSDIEGVLSELSS